MFSTVDDKEELNLMKWKNRLGYLMTVVSISSVLFMTTGCSHRAVHGMSEKSKAQGSGQLISDPGAFSSSDSAMLMDDGLSLADGSGSDLADETQSGKGLLEQESLFGEDGLVQELTPGESAQDYWDQRKQAELMTAQTGLRDIFFEFDSSHLTNQAKLTLTSNAEWLKSHPDARVTIEGHCDERGTRAYNYVLGEKRAIRTSNYLASLGVAPQQLQVMSYGKDNPLCKGSGDPCYLQNRRAHLVLNTVDLASAFQEDNEAQSFYDR